MSSIIALSGASGVGKTTQEGLVCDRLGAVKVITDTTRLPRENETEGVHYNFFAPNELDRVDLNDLLWRVPVHGYEYAARRSAFMTALTSTGLAIVAITPDKHVSLQKAFSEKVRVISIHLLSPDDAEIHQILKQRGHSREDIELRISDSRKFDSDARIVSGIHLVERRSVEGVYGECKRLILGT